ncbi:MAG: uroporphyrinogen-III synthase [Cyclobacteriaceae bacterium]|nr:uroporphyrinogen-III synthase [Cyclobacteriaceae bacterium]
MNHPLKDIHIVVTRDPDQSGNLIGKLTELGGKVHSFPTIKIHPPDDWTNCDKALGQIEKYHWIIFTSVNGVRYFMNRARHHRIKYFGASIAAVGKKTADELTEYGITANLIPSSYSAEGLLERFGTMDIRDQMILIPTSDRSGEDLPSGLKKMGASVEKITCYQTGNPDPEETDTAVNALLQQKMDCFTFYSPSAFRSLMEILDKKQLKELLSGETALAAIGPATARIIRKNGYEVRIQPEKSLDESMIEAIVSYFKKMN